jgi:hypothetical protein
VTTWKCTLDALAGLLGLPIDSSDVQVAVEGIRASVEVDDDGYGSADSHEFGLAVMVRRNRLLVRPTSAPLETMLVDAVHLFSWGREGHAEFSGSLRNGVRFGDSRADVRRKMGIAGVDGGGKWVSFLNRKGPLWTRYPFDNRTVMHMEFDDSDRLSLVTLMLGDEVPG